MEHRLIALREVLTKQIDGIDQSQNFLLLQRIHEVDVYYHTRLINKHRQQ